MDQESYVNKSEFSEKRYKLLAQRRGTESPVVKVDLSIAGIYHYSREKRRVNGNIICPALCIVIWKLKFLNLKRYFSTNILLFNIQII